VLFNPLFGVLCRSTCLFRGLLTKGIRLLPCFFQRWRNFRPYIFSERPDLFRGRIRGTTDMLPSLFSKALHSLAGIIEERHDETPD
jgi:hypothetical protein